MKLCDNQIQLCLVIFFTSQCLIVPKINCYPSVDETTLTRYNCEYDFGLKIILYIIWVFLLLVVSCVSGSIKQTSEISEASRRIPVKIIPELLQQRVTGTITKIKFKVAFCAITINALLNYLSSLVTCDACIYRFYKTGDNGRITMLTGDLIVILTIVVVTALILLLLHFLFAIARDWLEFCKLFDSSECERFQKFWFIMMSLSIAIFLIVSVCIPKILNRHFQIRIIFNYLFCVIITCFIIIVMEIVELFKSKKAVPRESV